MDVKEIMNFIPHDCSLSRNKVNRIGEHGYTINELLVLLAVVMIIVGLAVPGILRMRAQAKNETSAIELLRTVASSQAAYSKSCGLGGYAIDFAVLGKPTPNSKAGFIPAELKQTEAPQQNGYNFTLDAGSDATAGPIDCHGIPTRTAYFATAQPIAFGIAGTGNRSFAITDKRVIWQIQSGAAPDEPFAEPEVPLQ